MWYTSTTHIHNQKAVLIRDNGFLLHLHLWWRVVEGGKGTDGKELEEEPEEEGGR